MAAITFQHLVSVVFPCTPPAFECHSRLDSDLQPATGVQQAPSSSSTPASHPGGVGSAIPKQDELGSTPAPAVAAALLDDSQNQPSESTPTPDITCTTGEGTGNTIPSSHTGGSDSSRRGSASGASGAGSRRGSVTGNAVGTSSTSATSGILLAQSVPYIMILFNLFLFKKKI